jgi:hypothetical protein
MKSLKFAKVVFVLFFICFISACSSSGKINIEQAKSEIIVKGKTVSLLVEPEVENVKAVHQEVASRIRERLFGKLVADGLFKAVVHAPEPADYRMDVKVKGAREVSTGARIWLGVMAGSNNLTLAVKVFEFKSNREITAYQVQGSSASHPLSSEAGLDDAIREAVDKIVEGLK